LPIGNLYKLSDSYNPLVEGAMQSGKDLYGDLERIEARKKKRQPGLSSKFFSIFGKKDEDDEEEEDSVAKE
jgi:hypothetical protein